LIDAAYARYTIKYEGRIANDQTTPLISAWWVAWAQELFEIHRGHVRSHVHGYDGSYNAQLFKQLSPTMVAVLKAKFPQTA
jgi:hypothetical protein